MVIGYSIMKILHLIAVVLFLGNISTAIFWMHFAAKTRDLKLISHTVKGIIRADKLFTLPGAAILFIFGLGAALHGGLSIFGTGWILWSIVMFLISGFAFSAKLAPIQRKMYKLTSENQDNTAFEWNNFEELLHSWNIWGIVATLTPFLAFLMMILKFPK